MDKIIRLVGPNGSVELFGLRLVGVNAETGWKLLFTAVLVVGLLIVNRLIRGVARWALRGIRHGHVTFWTRQGVNLATAIILVLGVASIWFNEPAQLATAAGLFTAGLAFALQKVVTAVAGYFVILRGKTFNVGDRIRMGGVRGDVINLGFIQTTIMEMGEPPEVQSDEPGMWVKSRQYTGRVVTVSNAQIFDEPVFNYTRELPYLWEEIHLPVAYKDDRHAAERILLEAASRHCVPESELQGEVLAELQRRFGTTSEVGPRVYYRLTDNWLELSLRFVVRDHGIRDAKDAMSRDILDGLEKAGIGIASGTYDIVGLPPIRVESLPANGWSAAAKSR